MHYKQAEIVVTLLESTSLVAQLVKRLPIMWETVFNPWVGKISWRRKWEPTPGFFPGEFHGQRSLSGVAESDMTELLTLTGEYLGSYYEHLGM